MCIQEKQKQMNGSISLIIGPMFSGKTTELLRRLRKHEFAKKKCASVSYIKDVRYKSMVTGENKGNVSPNSFSTHDNIIKVADFKVDNLTKIKNKLAQFDAVAIDEGQFFKDVTTVSEYLANKGTVVIIAALCSNFKRESMGDIGNLISKVEKVTMLSAICMGCFKNSASFSFRTTTEKEEQVIGGEKKYLATCRQCYWILTAQKNKQKC